MTAKIKEPRGGTKWPKIITAGSASVKVYCVKHASNASGLRYKLAWHSPEGRKVQNFSDLEKAIEEGKLKAANLASGNIEGGQMTSGDRSELLAAREIAGPTFLAALKEWKAAQELTNGHLMAACRSWANRTGVGFKQITVKDAIDQFTKDKIAQGIDVKASYNRMFPALAEAFGDRPIDTISPRQLTEWLNTRYAHPVSRNTARKRSVALWRWARKNQHLPADALTAAEATDAAKEPKLKIGIIDPDTYSRLLHYFLEHNSEYLAALVIAGFAGLRRSEVHAQTWEQIDLVKKELIVTKAKENTPSQRIVPLCPAAVQWLRRCPCKVGPVCFDLAIDRLRLIARDEAKITIPENAFRHSYISHKVAQTGNIAETSLFAGNSPEIVRKHYKALVNKAQGRAWFKITPNGEAEAEIISIKETA